ncbi:MAG: hypothetical protein SVV03_00380 [Candidatus Nanohaloarchaea archaeon]|nr:hypothetical protein [Candidatus Nanohaloarchaea archaeon]
MPSELMTVGREPQVTDRDLDEMLERMKEGAEDMIKGDFDSKNKVIRKNVQRGE